MSENLRRGPRAVDDEDHAREIAREVGRLPLRWRIVIGLVAAASAPAGVLTGIIPWGLRTAGIAMQKDVDSHIAAVTQAQQIADKLAAERHDAIKAEQVAAAKKLIDLGKQVRSIDVKLSKRARVAVTPAGAPTP